MEKLLTKALVAAIVAMGGGVMIARVHFATEEIAQDFGRSLTGHRHCASYDQSSDCFRRPKMVEVSGRDRRPHPGH